MSDLCRVTVGDTTFRARAGDRILDAALTAGCDLPHDCRSGQCGSCLVRVIDGHVLGGESSVPGSVHACQAVVLSNLNLAHDPVPVPEVRTGRVTAVVRLSREVSEVTIATDTPFEWRPGQYASFAFEGFPERAYSPTVALDGYDLPGTFRLHVRHVDGGRVSGEIGRGIADGHRVSIDGPYGAAFLRPDGYSRLVLYSTGTGFAPVWSIADAVLRTGDPRPLVIIAGARSVYDLYMAQALERMSQCANVAVVPVVTEQHELTPHVRMGSPLDFASLIADGDVVHAAGAPQVIESLRIQTSAVGVPLYADPFTPATESRSAGWIARAAERIRRARAIGARHSKLSAGPAEIASPSR